MAELPVEVITELLIGLPVKSLLRFRCVSKRWRALIDGQNFVKSHLRRSLEHKRLVLGGNGTLHFLNHDETEIVAHPFLDTSVKEACFTSLLGSCDGLVLIERVQRDDNICLLNPSTQNYVDLPFFPVDESPGFDVDDYDQRKYYGLGYDSVSDDYKVVRIVEWHHLESGYWLRSDTMVYSLKSNLWRKVRDFPYCLPEDRPMWGAHVKGILHTTLLINDQESIVGFDLSTEDCRLIQLPEGFDRESKSMHVTVLRGCLCLLGGYIDHRTDVWVMKDYGVMQSWMKLFTVAPPTLEAYMSVVPLVYSRDGSEVLLNYDNKKLIWYDLRAESVRDAHARCLPWSFYAAVFVESLVPIHIFDVVKKQPGQVKPKEKKEKPKRDGFLSTGFKLKL